MKRYVCLPVCLLALLGGVGGVEAATLTVCASGCQYSNLQPAIDAAVGGDVIMLRAGQTFVGNFVLRAKSTSSTSYITIRSDAPDSSFPASGVRLIPPGKSGANVASGTLARLLGQGGSWKSTPVIRTEPGAHHYKLEFLDVDGSANLGYETLMQLGENDSYQTTTSSSPYSLVLDRVYVHGHPTKGMKRGIAIDTRSTDILDSYISDIMSVSDAQAIAGFNGAGPFRIINNYLEAAGENIMFGGSDPKTPYLVPSDIEIRGNHVYKQPSWQQPVLKPVSSISHTAGTGGSLAAGTYYFEIVAVMSAGGANLVSAPSTEVAVTVSSSGSVAFSWSGVSGADRYRIYRGTTSKGESKYLETTTASTSFTYKGSSELSGTPASNGTRWTAKNLLEFKNAQRVTVDGNIFENNWAGFQTGYAILMTPRNQDNTAPWTVVQNIAFTHNLVRHVGGAFDVLGYDDANTSQQTNAITIADNALDDVSSTLGDGRFITITGGPKNLTINHNTIVNTGTVVNVGGPAVYGFVFTNNFSKHNTYGVQGQNHAPGNDTLNYYFPGAVFQKNVLAGGSSSAYPSGNYFPTVTEFWASFTDYASEDFALVSTSPYNNAGTDGTDIGLDMTALDSADAGVLSGALTTASSGGTSTSTSGSTSGTTTTTPASLPAGWDAEDIGAVGVSGSSGYASGTFTIAGGGADIWGTADALQFAYQSMTGDGTIVARVASVQGGSAWTKVGVMIRGTSDPGAAQAMMLVSAGKGLAFQRRKVNGGSSYSTAGPTGTAPRWVKLVRSGSTITAYASSDGSTWTTVGSDTFTMPSTVLVGLGVSSHDTTSLATGTFDHVTVTGGQVLPAGWESNDVGSVGLKGSASESGGTFTVTGAGADIWGTVDAFHFASTTLDADGSIVARVASLSGTDAWTKAGVMMRLTLDAGSAHGLMLVSVAKGLAFQRRTVTGGTSTSTSGGAGTAPRWVKLSRQGQVVTASVSGDGVTWTVVGSDTLSISGSLQVGLAVSSHSATALATATFDNVRVSTTP